MNNKPSSTLAILFLPTRKKCIEQWERNAQWTA